MSSHHKYFAPLTLLTFCCLSLIHPPDLRAREGMPQTSSADRFPCKVGRLPIVYEVTLASDAPNRQIRMQVFACKDANEGILSGSGALIHDSQFDAGEPIVVDKFAMTVSAGENCQGFRLRSQTTLYEFAQINPETDFSPFDLRSCTDFLSSNFNLSQEHPEQLNVINATGEPSTSQSFYSVTWSKTFGKEVSPVPAVRCPENADLIIFADEINAANAAPEHIATLAGFANPVTFASSPAAMPYQLEIQACIGPEDQINVKRVLFGQMESGTRYFEVLYFLPPGSPKPSPYRNYYRRNYLAVDYLEEHAIEAKGLAELFDLDYREFHLTINATAATGSAWRLVNDPVVGALAFVRFTDPGAVGLQGHSFNLKLVTNSVLDQNTDTKLCPAGIGSPASLATTTILKFGDATLTLLQCSAQQGVGTTKTWPIKIRVSDDARHINRDFTAKENNDLTSFAENEVIVSVETGHHNSSYSIDLKIVNGPTYHYSWQKPVGGHTELEESCTKSITETSGARTSFACGG